MFEHFLCCYVLIRCREKQRKEASRLQTVNRKLSAMNKLLMEENDRLQKQVSQLVYENGYMRQQINTVSCYYNNSLHYTFHYFYHISYVILCRLQLLQTLAVNLRLPLPSILFEMLITQLGN